MNIKTRARLLLAGALVALGAGVPRFAGASCGTTKLVKLGGGGGSDCANIAACVAMIPSTLTGSFCIEFLDNATYNEAITIGDIAGSYEIIIRNTCYINITGSI